MMKSTQSKQWPRYAVREFPFSASTYPGRRPRFSFLFTHRYIYRFGLSNLDQLLALRDLPPLSDRYAVLAYGSNACPGQLLLKHRENNRLTNVPVLYGRLIGAEAVYVRRHTRRGYIPATLARKGGSQPSWLTLLTTEQLKAMDATEGRPNFYALAEVPTLRFLAGHHDVSPLYTYVDIHGGVMILHGQTVSLRQIGQARCQRIFDNTTRQDAVEWLDFHEIPDSDLPQRTIQGLIR